MPIGIRIELDLCKKCMQMKNHKIMEYPMENKIIRKCLRCGFKTTITEELSENHRKQNDE